MKSTIKILTFLIFILTISACNEEIEILNPQPLTAIVFGLLDSSEDIHFLKITKSLPGTSDAYDAAQDSDLNYFKTVHAVIYEVKNNIDTLRQWELADTTISTKDSGAFYYPTQKVYHFNTDKKAPLLKEKEIKYVLIAYLDGNKITSETELISGASISSPSITSSLSFANSDISKQGYAFTPVIINSGTATIANVSLRVHVKEINASSTDSSFVYWNVNDLSVSANSKNQINIKGEEFYKLLKAKFAISNEYPKRILNQIDIIVSFGSENLRNFIELSKPSSELSQSKTTFTNIKTTEKNFQVRGIFTSRESISLSKKSWFKDPNYSSYYRLIDASSMKELCKGIITNKLNFYSDVPTDVNESYYLKP